MANQATEREVGKYLSDLLASSLAAFLGKNSIHDLAASEREFVDEQANIFEYLVDTVEIVAAEASTALKRVESCLEQERAARLKQELELEDALARLAEERAERERLALMTSALLWVAEDPNKPDHGITDDVKAAEDHSAASHTDSDSISSSFASTDELKYECAPLILTVSDLCSDTESDDVRLGDKLDQLVISKPYPASFVLGGEVNGGVSARGKSAYELKFDIGSVRYESFVFECAPQLLSISDLYSEMDHDAIGQDQVPAPAGEEEEYGVASAPIQLAFQFEYDATRSSCDEHFAFDYAHAAPRLSMSDLYFETESGAVKSAVDSDQRTATKAYQDLTALACEAQYVAPSAPEQFAFDLSDTKSHSCEYFSFEYECAPPMLSISDLCSQTESASDERDIKVESESKFPLKAESAPFNALTLSLEEEVTALERDVTRLKSLKGLQHEALAMKLLDRVREVSARVIAAGKETAISATSTNRHDSVKPGRALTMRMDTVLSTLISDRTTVLTKMWSKILCETVHEGHLNKTPR